MSITGIVKEIKEVSNFNGDFLLTIQSEYKTDNKSLIHKGIFIEKVNYIVLIRSYYKPQLLLNCKISGEIFAHGKDHFQHYLEIKLN